MHWFCSDNGPEGNAKSPGSAGPFRGRKRSLYEGGVRVPGLLVWPERVKAGSTSVFPAVTSDYVPTIAATLGVTLPHRPMDGMSLLPVLEGELTERPEPIAFESKGRVALSGNRFKLLTTGKLAKPELYDLVADPAETRNLSDAHSDVVKRMTDVLRAWRASCQKSDRGEDYP